MNAAPTFVHRNIILSLAAILLSLSLATFAGKPASAADRNILTTILPLYIFTGNLLNGIDGISLELLIDGDNANPHTYSMTIKGLKKISAAHVIIANGKAEEFLDMEKVRDMNPRAALVLTHNVSSRAKHLPSVKTSNPHTWLSPKRAILECQEISRALGEIFPHMKGTIEENMRGYRKRLEALSDQIASSLGAAGNLEIITFHDALDIFAKDFGISILYHIEEVHGIPPSPRKLGEILETIKARGSRVILVSESPEPDAITKMIAARSNAPTVWFDPIISGNTHLSRYEKTMGENVEKLATSFTM